MDRQFDTLYGYLALARRPGTVGSVDDRTRLLVRQLAAEQSGCRWCIDHARHDWRAAGLPVDLLSGLARHAPESGFSDAERAALSLVDAVSCGGAREAIAAVRRYFSERAVAELIACLADHHLLTNEHS
jgi:alkylhydroperoxidase family enzyme